MSRPSPSSTARWQPRHRDIAAVLCAATLDALHPAAATLAKHPFSLTCRVGSGARTCHQLRPLDRWGLRQTHLITYGAGMVASKLGGERWQSHREIEQRGYFGGTLTPLGLLAHTCCHEYAHALHTARGLRRRGAVHDAAYYALLDRLHHDGHAEQVRTALQQRLSSAGIVLPTTLPPPVAPAATPELAVGDPVSFDYRGRTFHGTVRRINRRSVTVIPLQGGEQGWWRVSPERLYRRVAR